MARKKMDPEQTTENAEAPESAAEAAAESAEAAAEPSAPAETPAENTEPSAEETLAELKDQHLRLAAEYDNYRKRTAKEREQLYSMAKASTVEAILPVYDNLALAVAQESSDAQYKKGVEMIARQLDEVFAKLGVSEIPAARGDAFDPALHNAVMHIEDPELQENRIAAVFQKGFKVGDKVIHHAVVQVAN